MQLGQTIQKNQRKENHLTGRICRNISCYKTESLKLGE